MTNILENKITYLVTILTLLGMIIAGVVWLQGVKAEASEGVSLAKENAEIQKQLSSIIVADNAKLQLLLEMSGFTKEEARKWSLIARECAEDSVTHKPIPCEWLETSENLKLGLLYKLDDSLKLSVDTLWNFTKKD